MSDITWGSLSDGLDLHRVRLNVALLSPQVDRTPHRRDAEAAEKSLRRRERVDLQVPDLIAPTLNYNVYAGFVFLFTGSRDPRQYTK
jgi:hypothetical protein